MNKGGIFMQRYILALDQGHDQLARHSVRARWQCRRTRAAAVSAVLSAARLGRARPERDLGERARRCRAGLARIGPWPRGRGDRHHEPARDDDSLGSRDGRAHPQRHRLAVPPHGGHRGCPSRKARRERACGRENGIAHRRLLFRDEDQVAARPRPQRAGKGPSAAKFYSVRWRHGSSGG